MSNKKDGGGHWNRAGRRSGGDHAAYIPINETISDLMRMAAKIRREMGPEAEERFWELVREKANSPGDGRSAASGGPNGNGGSVNTTVGCPEKKTIIVKTRIKTWMAEPLKVPKSFDQDFTREPR